MKTQKQIFHLKPPKPDAFAVCPSNESEPEPADLILWTVRLYDHILVMPELEALLQSLYFES